MIARTTHGWSDSGQRRSRHPQSSHLPSVSQPDAVVKVILEAAASAGG